MAFTEKITLVISTVTGQTTSQLKKLKSDIDGTEGSFNKMKTGAAGAFDSIKANAGALALGAGAAIAAFGAKAVASANELALSVGKMSDALGLTNEEASRWAEVVGDLGISTETLTKSMGIMLRTAETAPDAFSQFGAQIQYAADGSVDANATFLNVIDTLNGIKDPAERAAAAQKLLGRGWMEMSELIGQGADQVKTSLESVSGAKIVTPQQVKEAREMRAALDNLSDAVEEVTLKVGSELVPAFTKTASVILTVANAAGKLSDAYEKITDAPIVSTIYKNIAPWEQLRTRIEQAGDAYNAVFNADEVDASISPELIASWEAQSAAIEETGDAADGAKSKLSAYETRALLAGKASERAADQVREQNEALLEVKSAADEAKESTEGFASALDDVFGSATDVQGANDAVLQSFEDLTATVKENGRTLDENTEAGRNNREAVRESVGGIEDMTSTLAENGATTDQVNAKYTEMRNRLVSQVATAFNITEGEASAYIDTLGLTPDKVTTAVQLQGDEAAKAKVQDYLQNNLGKIPPEVASAIKADIDDGAWQSAWNRLQELKTPIYTPVIPVSQGAAAAGNRTANRENQRAIAIGGTPGRDEITTVGEYGTEVVDWSLGRPKVVPRAESANILGDAPRGGDTFIINALDPRAIAAEIQRQQWAANARPRGRAA